MIETHATSRLLVTIALSAALLLGISLRTIRSRAADGGDVGSIGAFRSLMIDYFVSFGLVPVLATRDFSIGDVVQADGVDFLAKGSACFPGLAMPVATPQELPGSIQTKTAALDVGLSLTRVFSGDAQASLVHRVNIRFSDVTSREVDLKSLRASLDRKACPEIAPMIDGTLTVLKNGEQPLFVVSAVYLGKPEATVDVLDKAQLGAEIERIGQIGRGKFTASAGVGNTVNLKSDRPVVIALRPVTVPKVAPISSFSMRGNEGVEAQWEEASCTPGAECESKFRKFTDIEKAWVPEPKKQQ